MTDGYETRFGASETAALRLTDALIGHARPLDAQTAQALRAHFTEAEIAELALGIALFLAMSKVLICLGLEPEQMPLTVVPTPGSG